MEVVEERETSSLRARRKKSSVSLSCCFNGHRRADSFDVVSSSCVSPSPKMSPSAWMRSKTNYELPDIKIKGRYKNLMSRMGRHRRHSSADFSYDPLSYSLNFEDGDHHHHDTYDAAEEFPVRSFAARLPSSPPSPAAADGRRKMLQINMMMPRSKTPEHELPTTSSTRRAAAVAEVRKSLELLPTPSRKVEDLRSSRSSEDVAEGRGSPDIPTPTRPRKVITTTPETTKRNSNINDMRRNLEEVSSTLVVSPTSRQVLVELC
ncbi:hypothetical protein ACH5RR_040047 [Cinchona calisaya]|uniref:Uncharacterized protein n=1 Tax=Cinchona calisaya TaxID=153742 RepID=A0ABD2XTN3_9GENT